MSVRKIMADTWHERELRALPPTAKQIAETLTQYGAKRNFTKNSVLIAQDSQICEILFIIKGTASSHTVLRNGAEIWGFDFEPGDFAGHNAYFQQRSCLFEIRATTHLSALSIPTYRFAEIIKQEADICAHTAQDLSNRLSLMSQRMLELSSLPAPERICAELLRMAKPIGIEEGKMIIRPGPIFTKLANRVNSTRETVSRTVAELQRTGVVSKEPGALRIEYPAKIMSKAL